MFKTTVGQSQNVVANLASLAGLSIPNPELNEGALVAVNDDGTGQAVYYGLFTNLTDPPAVDNVNVLDTILGGSSRWMRLKTEFGPEAETPPQDLAFHSFGRVANDGSGEAGFNYESSQVATGHYLVVVGGYPQGVDGSIQAIFGATARFNVTTAMISWEQGLPREFHVYTADAAGVLVDRGFTFNVLIGDAIPPP